MKRFFLVLVLISICIVPSQSQGAYEISDSIIFDYDVFKSSSTKPISLDQNIYESLPDSVIYEIGVKNTGETGLINVTLYDQVQPGMKYVESYDESYVNLFRQ
jgi:uncharacterized repeat protein (TIGR01451 family)